MDRMTGFSINFPSRTARPFGLASKREITVFACAISASEGLKVVLIALIFEG
jgi:hypothetical protein